MNKRLQHFKNRYEELKNARAEFEPDWKQLNKFLAPSTGMLYTDPANDKDKRRYTYPKDNLNGLPQRYMRNLSTALVATLCPPDSRWFGYSVPNMTDEEQSWLHKASDRVMAIFQARGISSYLEALFYEGAVYGLSCMSMEKSNKYKLDFGNFTIGEFYLDDDFEGNENTLYHRFAMNTRQLKEWFGYDKLPQRLRDELDSGKKFTTWNVIQAIEPNPDYLPEFKNEFNKAYVSYIWLEGLNADDCVLEEKGMRDFPFIVFHWYRKINTPYTMGLGHDVLPDVKELQALERDTKRARAKKINPPLRADPSLKNAGVKVGSDDINWTNNKEGVTPLYNVNFDTQEGQVAIQEKEQKLYQLTYNYLFSQIINRNKTMSATEVNKVSQEELILLGGIVQNATMALGAVCERAFKLLYEQGELPENMPESLRGKIMNTTFHSLMAQSQSLSDLKLVERWLQAMSIMAQMNPNAMRKVDVFRIADEYARRLDIDTGLVVPTEEVEKQIQSEINAQREAQQQQMKADALKAMGSATKDFAEAGTIAQQIQGVM
jgi:hypothetical protein